MSIQEVQSKPNSVKALFRAIGKMFKTALLILICASTCFFAYRGGQPMAVPQAPSGMTYFMFISNFITGAQDPERSRYTWGMLLSLAILGPLYTTVYTAVGINPEGKLARVTAPDAGIPQGVRGAAWYEVPGIWWETLERLSWTMLGRKVE